MKFCKFLITLFFIFQFDQSYCSDDNKIIIFKAIIPNDVSNASLSSISIGTIEINKKKDM